MSLRRKCNVSEHISQHVRIPFQTGGPDIKVYHDQTARSFPSARLNMTPRRSTGEGRWKVAENAFNESPESREEIKSPV